MTADDRELAAAQSAVALGMAVAQQYHELAGPTPGVGLQVALPSTPNALGLMVGEGYNLPETAPALRPATPPPAPQAVYASPVAGGSAHLGFEGAPQPPAELLVFDVAEWQAPGDGDWEAGLRRWKVGRREWVRQHLDSVLGDPLDLLVGEVRAKRRPAGS